MHLHAAVLQLNVFVSLLPRVRNQLLRFAGHRHRTCQTGRDRCVSVCYLFKSLQSAAIALGAEQTTWDIPTAPLSFWTCCCSQPKSRTDSSQLSTATSTARDAGPVRSFTRCGLSAVSRASRRPVLVRAAGVSTGGKLSIQVISNPSQATLQELGVSSWPTWGCDISKFPWSYRESETCYVIEGHVIVTPDSGEAVEIRAGDMATFPAGMSCTWDVKEAIQKHYNFH